MTAMAAAQESRLTEQRPLPLWNARQAFSFLFHALVLTLLPSQHAGAEENTSRPCEKSGYCSAGLTKPWSGDIKPAGALNAALEARNFKNEVIFMYALENRMHDLLQAYYDMYKQGYGHILLLLYEESDCKTASKLFPEVGCAYSTILSDWQPVGLGSIGFMQVFRHYVAARAVRMGYNVFSLDADVAFLDDPYHYLKHPTLAGYTMITQMESAMVNVGVMYMQNVKPNGVALWILAEIVDRSLRYHETLPQKDRNPHGIGLSCATWEQALCNEALLSTMAGRPMFFHVYRCAHNKPHAESVIKAVEKMLPHHEQLHQVTSGDVPPDWPSRDGRGFLGYKVLAKMPHSKGEWPEELGGRILFNRSAASAAFIEELRADNPAAPLWPDAEDTSEEALRAAQAIPSEQVLLAAAFLMGPWNKFGMMGLWEAQDRCHKQGRPLPPPERMPVQPHAVVGHMHVTGCGSEGGVAKGHIALVLGHWDWEVSRRLYGPDGVYFASHRSRQLPLLVAFSPSLTAELHKLTRNGEELKVALRGLYKLAMLTGRHMVLPALDCGGDTWMGVWKDDGCPLRDDIPLADQARTFSNRPHRDMLVYGSRFNRPQCVWIDYLAHGCVDDHEDADVIAALLPEEYEYYKQQMLSGAINGTAGGTPAAPSTQLLTPADFPSARQAVAGGKDQELPELSNVTVVSEADVVALGLKYSTKDRTGSPNVLLLDMLVDVELSSDGARQQFKGAEEGRCQPLKKGRAPCSCPQEQCGQHGQHVELYKLGKLRRSLGELGGRQAGLQQHSLQEQPPAFVRSLWNLQWPPRQ